MYNVYEIQVYQPPDIKTVTQESYASAISTTTPTHEYNKTY
jgi:hypothetical protein